MKKNLAISCVIGLMLSSFNLSANATDWSISDVTSFDDFIHYSANGDIGNVTDDFKLDDTWISREFKDWASGTQGIKTIKSADGTQKTISGVGNNKYINIGGNNVTIQDLILKELHNSGFGGAIYINNEIGTSFYGTGTISNCIFDSNSSTEGSYGGGAVFNNKATVNITNSEFKNNKAINMSGGAILNRSNDSAEGIATITDCIFNNNSAKSKGGAIYNDGKINLSGTNTFENNTATESFGGAIYNAGTVNFTGTNTFTGNNVSSKGGAIYNSTGAKINLSGINTFSNNNASGTPNDIYNAGTLNINDGITTINGGILGTGTTNIKSGATLVLNRNTSGLATLVQEIVKFTDGTLSLGNGYAEDILPAISLGSSGTTGYFNIDIDGSNSDKFTISSGSLTAKLQAINLNSAPTTTEYTWLTGEALSTGTLSDGTDAQVKSALGDLVYVFNKTVDGKILYTGTKENVSDYNIKDIISSNIFYYYYTYDLTEDNTANGNLGNLSGENRTINGNGYNINGSSFKGVTVSAGQIFNLNNITIKDFVNTGNGGAIYNAGNMSITGATFGGNNASDGNTALNGGAINNGATLSISGSAFKNNTATSQGGAIWNGSTGLTISGTNTFDSNSAQDGGAIYNTQTITISGENTFESNTATNNGGAIYNLGNATEGIINFSGTNTFTSNTANGVNNDIYNDGGTLNINSGITTINGGISGTGTTNINGGTLAFGNGATFTDGTLNLNGGTLSLINGNIDSGINPFNITKMTLSANSSIAIDANLADGETPFDKINVTNFTTNSPSYTINISNIKVLHDFTNPDTVSKTYDISEIITSTSGNIQNYVECNLTNVVGYSPIYKYNFNYDKTTGKITASRSGGENYDIYNPAILPSPVSSQIAGYATMLENFDQGFKFADNFMSMTKAQRMAYRDRNKYALLDNTPQYTGSASKSAWVTPYTSFENVKLDNGPDIDAITYGTYFGGDSELYSLRHGWEAVYSLFAGYNGAYQTFGGVNMNYNGGSLGAAATFFKGNFFTAIDVAVGGGVSTANTMFGMENSTMLSAGGAIKAGYNFEFKEGRHIIQPSLLVGYSFTNTFDYTNAVGIDITSDPLHAIIIQPQIKYIMNLKNGWQPYAAVSMVFNIMDKSRFYAQDIALPEMSMRPYVQYGLGLQKTWGERCTGYVQAMVRNGGRNGVALSLGFKWQLGKGTRNNSL